MNKFISICVIYHVFYNYVQYVTFGQIFKDLIYEEISSCYRCKFRYRYGTCQTFFGAGTSGTYVGEKKWYNGRVGTAKYDVPFG